MKKSRRSSVKVFIRSCVAVLASLALAFALIGCTEEPTPSTPTEQPAQTEQQPAEQSATYIFTDSAGRQVELPKNIERIAPSGPLAQLVLFTVCPDKLVGFASDISDMQFEYIDKKYAALPVFGNFYGDTLNLESVMAANPQVIIDIGEAKPSIGEDMDGIQDRTGIPTIFIHMEMDSMVSAYQTLGEVTGETEQAQRIIEYIETTQTETRQKVATIPEPQRLTVYYGQDEGLTAIVAGTVHSDVIDIAGGINVAQVEETIRGGASDISMEQLILWNPDVILFAPGSIYDSASTRPEWAEVTAIQNGDYYEVPDGPYNWMGRPPSVNRVLGIKWLSNLLYPEVFNYDMVQETKEFYKLFYHCDVTDEQVKALLSGSSSHQ